MKSGRCVFCEREMLYDLFPICDECLRSLVERVVEDGGD